MKILRFDAWVNALKNDDPGHMAMYDWDGDYYYEYAMGDLLTDRNLNPFGIQFNQVAETKLPNGGPLVKNRTLTILKYKKDQYFRSQLMKMGTGAASRTLRFTNLFYITVEVSDEEWNYIQKLLILRAVGGSYSFVKETQVKDPLAARCLSVLEDLAVYRKQKLGVGSALQILKKFADLNQGVEIKEDHLISY